LAEYRNKISPVIPRRVITRPPTAELAPDQFDQDSLPPYDALDKILDLFIEQDLSIEDIVQHGFDRELVKKVVKMVCRNEYKRRQSPTGVRISEKAFGRDRRYPITSAYLKKELM
jgi:NAD+ synthase (glutamine-hydrolysing)